MCLYIFTETSSCSYKIPIKEHGCSYVLDLRKKKPTLVNKPGNKTVVCRMALSPGTLGNDISANINRSPRKASSGPVHSEIVCLCK